jgi:hypothetical protein
MAESAHVGRLYSAAMLERLVEPLRSAGVSPEVVLRAGGLEETDLASSGTLVSIDQILTVY